MARKIDSLQETIQKQKDAFYSEDDYETKKNHYLDAVVVWEAYEKENDFFAYKKEAVGVFNDLRKMAKALGYYEDAIKWCEKAIQQMREVVAMASNTKNKRELSLWYDRLGEIYEENGELYVAREWYQKELKALKELDRTKSTDESKRDLVISYNNLGNVAVQLGDLSEARKWYEKGLELAKGLSKEGNRDLEICYFKLGNVEEYDERLKKAKGLYAKAMEIAINLYEESKTVETMHDLSVGCDYLGNVEEKLGDYEEAK
ncbi:MAG: tetratricopeptide repeat protein, partial [Erysipelotrichaceae bacterium]|nr:tetratricopeptide repeat protein [Erysipelotrichaceae bacterium]